MMQGRRIAVITPTFETPVHWLNQCIKSVQGQSIGPVDHILINDGDPRFTPPARFDGYLVDLAHHYGDFGDTPRWFGVQKALERGAQIIAFLDADNWYERNHLENCIMVAEARQAQVVASQRMLVTLDGKPIIKCDMCGTRDFADTSSMVFFASAFEALRAWIDMEDWQHPIDDRIVWHRVKQMGYRIALTSKVTLNYRCTHRLFYESFDLPIPKGVKTALDVEVALERWECP